MSGRQGRKGKALGVAEPLAASVGPFGLVVVDPLDSGGEATKVAVSECVRGQGHDSRCKYREVDG